MKLSEAILLGSTVLAPKSGGQYFSEMNAGCALGMAAIAKGCTFRPVSGPIQEYDRRTLGTEGVWGDWVLVVMERPCKCWRIQAPREMRIKDIIAHIFDTHVARKKDWTLEQLVTWVKTVEPHEVSAAATKTPVRDRAMPYLVWPPRKAPASVEEVDHWAVVRQAFLAKYSAGHKHRHRG